jgi:hypothetical protein
MDEARRARLVERRRLAQLRIRRAELSATFRHLGRILCERGVRFSKLVPERCREALGTLASGPGEDERLLWGPIRNGVCSPWSSDPHRDSLLRSALAACARDDEAVAVVWHPCRAGLRIRAGDLASQSAAILGELHDTVWIVAAAGGPWLIEVAYWDGELCYTPAMPLFVGRP